MYTPPTDLTTSCETEKVKGDKTTLCIVSVGISWGKAQESEKKAKFSSCKKKGGKVEANELVRKAKTEGTT